MPISRDLGFFSLSGRVKTDKWPLELARPPGQGRRLSLAAGPRRLLSRASGSRMRGGRADSAGGNLLVGISKSQISHMGVLNFDLIALN